MRTIAAPRRPVARADRRALGIVLTTVAVVLGGAWITHLEPTHPPLAASGTAADPRRAPAAHAAQAREAELRQRFDQAVRLLAARHFAPAIAELHRVLELAPDMPEAHVNMGFSLLGLQRHHAARDAFERATVLNPRQANAYYGLALAYEGRSEFDLAIGAMRSYLHLARAEDEAHLRQARAALWEWESRLAAGRAQARR